MTGCIWQRWLLTRPFWAQSPSKCLFTASQGPGTPPMPQPHAGRTTAQLFVGPCKKRGAMPWQSVQVENGWNSSDSNIQDLHAKAAKLIGIVKLLLVLWTDMVMNTRSVLNYICKLHHISWSNTFVPTICRTCVEESEDDTDQCCKQNLLSAINYATGMCMWLQALEKQLSRYWFRNLL